MLLIFDHENYHLTSRSRTISCAEDYENDLNDTPTSAGRTADTEKATSNNPNVLSIFLRTYIFARKVKIFTVQINCVIWASAPEATSMCDVGFEGVKMSPYCILVLIVLQRIK